MYDRVLCDIPRTNNFCESYNKQLNSFIENKKPPFYTFVKKLQARSQDKKNWVNDLFQSHVAKAHYDIDQEMAGRKVKRPRKRANEQRDVAIRAMLQQYPTFEDKRSFLESMVRLTSSSLK